MLFPSLALGVLLLSQGIECSPVLKQPAVDDSTTLNARAPLPQDDRVGHFGGAALEERQLALNFRKFVKGTIVVGAAAYAVGDSLWTDLYKRCQAYHNNEPPGEVAESGVACVYRAFEATLKFAFWWRKFSGSANTEAILNSLVGETKRDATHGQNFDFHGHWHRLNADQQSHVRSQLPPTPGFWMHSLGDGSPDVANSASFHFAADGANQPSFRHVTNGSHGFIHTMSPADDKKTDKTSKRAILNLDDLSFNFGQSVNGIKFSYVHPCSQDYGDINEGDLEAVTDDMVKSFLAGGTDKFAMEFDMNNGPVMYGKMIVEGSGFGMNYEGIDFTPPYYNSCHDEL